MSVVCLKESRGCAAYIIYYTMSSSSSSQNVGRFRSFLLGRKREKQQSKQEHKDDTSSRQKPKKKEQKVDLGGYWSSDGEDDVQKNSQSQQQLVQQQQQNQGYNCDNDGSEVQVVDPPKTFTKQRRLKPSKLSTITGKAAAALVIHASFDTKEDTFSDNQVKTAAANKTTTPETADHDSDETEFFPTAPRSTNKMRARLDDGSAIPPAIPPPADASIDEHDDANSESLLSDVERSSTTEQDNHSFATIDSFKSQCWKCSVKLQLPDQFCLYAMHLHPLLKIPICCVCADQVLAVEEDEKQCSGCARDEDEVETMFLCDSCPKAFCETCVACANGGGEEGMTQVDLLCKSDDQWSCPCCKPPAPLHTLQAHTERIGEEQESRERTFDDIMSELDRVELERTECEKTEQPDVLDRKRAEFRAELLKTMSSCPVEEIDEAVEEEVEEWKQMWAKHDARLADRVLSLQEEIELRGENLAGCYAAIQGETIIDAVEPAWKKAADAELLRREHQEDEDDDMPLQSKFKSLELLSLLDT